MKGLTDQQKVIIAFSAYGPNSWFTLDRWFYCQEWRRNNPKKLPQL